MRPQAYAEAVLARLNEWFDALSYEQAVLMAAVATVVVLAIVISEVNGGR